LNRWATKLEPAPAAAGKKRLDNASSGHQLPKPARMVLVEATRRADFS
jgi:hypothetical protein